MPIDIRPVNSVFLLLIGAILLIAGSYQAVKKKDRPVSLVLWLSLVDAGFVFLGFGSGGADGSSGAVIQLVFAGIARLTAYMCLAKLCSRATGRSLAGLRGIGKAMPVTATIFAFAMFCAIEISPFLTPDGKLFIQYSSFATGQWVVPALIVCANIIMVVLTVLVVHPIWLESGSYEKTGESVTDCVPAVACAIILALLGIFGHSFAHMVAEAVSDTAEPVQGFALSMPLAVWLPFIGSVVAYIAGTQGENGKKLRNLIAVVCLAIAFIAFAADSSATPLARLFGLVATGIGLMVVIYSCGYITHDEAISSNAYFFFLLMLFASLAGLATAESLGTFFVYWEVMTFTSYVLVAYEGTEKAHKAAVKYFLMCAVAAAVMLPGLLLLAAHFGTLDIQALSLAAPMLGSGVAGFIAVLALIGLGVKAGLVPGHSWLPDAHPAAPSSISAPLSGLLTKTGIFGIVQVFFIILGVSTLSGGNEGIPTVGLLVSFLGIVTLLYGEIMALRQTDIKRLLAYSTMGQLGEITLTIGLCSYLATTGALLHLINHAVMKDLLFFCSGALILRAGTRELSGLKGLGRAMPFTATCMVIGLLSILGLPPFAGFMSKFMMLYSIASVSPMAAAVMLIASMAGVVYYTRILKTLIFEPYEGPAVEDAPLCMAIPLGILAAFCIILGVFPGLGLSLASAVSESLVNTGKLTAQALPDMSIHWPLASIVLIVGAIVPYILKSDRKAAGRASAWIMVAGAVLAALFELHLDTLSYMFAVAIPVFGALNTFYAVGYMEHSHTQWRFYTFFLIMTGGLIGVVTSSDLFNFFLFWEIMSSWSLYFVIVHEENAESLREGFKYFFFNVLGAAFLFLGVVLLIFWSKSGSFADIRATLPGLEDWQLGLAFFTMATGFVMKAAQLPFRIDIQMHPKTAPTPVSGYISSVLLKSAIFGLVKLFVVLGGVGLISGAYVLYSQSFIMDIVVWIGGITIVMAALYAVFQDDLKLIFIYSTVSQLGYMVVGVALGSSLGVAGGLLHLFNHMLFKDLLFLVAGAVLLQTHKHSINSMGGLGAKMPITMLCFAVGAFCVVGLPPSNGFTSKWIIYHALMEQGYVLVAVLSLMGSLITLAYIAKTLHTVYLGQTAPELEHVEEAPKSMLTPMLIIVAGCVITSIFPGVILGPLNSVLAQVGLQPLDIAPWGVASGRGAWNATATAVMFAAALFGGKYVLLSLTKTRRESPVHICGNDVNDLNLRTSSHDIYTAPSDLLTKLKKKLW